MGVLIAAVTPSSLVATVLSMQPFRWIGERSYGIYLWHMPLVAFLPGVIRGGSPLVSSIAVVAGTLILASLSWRYVEDPIREYGLRAALTTPRRPEDTLRAALLSTLISTLTSITRMLDVLRRRVTDASPSSSEPDPVPTARPTHAPAPEPATAWEDPEPAQLEPAPLREEPVDVAPTRIVEESVDVTPSRPTTPGGSVEPSSADTRRFALPTEVTVLQTAPSVLNLPPAPKPAATPVSDGPTPSDDGPVDQPRRRPVARAVTATLVVLGLAIGAMVGVSYLDTDLPVVSALYHPDTGGSGIDEDVDDAPPPARFGPTLPAAQRRTRCSTVVHVGDSTSIGMDDPSMQPDPALRLSGRYVHYGAKTYASDVVGGRSSVERLNVEPNATESIQNDLARGLRGCWVVAMGINDTANVEVGGQGPVDMRIDNLMKPLAGQPVLWPTVATNSLNENPAYDNEAMQRFNRALVHACKRYPNLRVYDWAGELNQEWFLDGVHYTEAGYVERARRFAVALATVYPATDLPPAGCVLKSTEAVVARR